MRVLDSSFNHNSYSASQFLRGALMYARQNWWMVLFLAYLTYESLVKWHSTQDGRLLFALSLAAFIISFWWACYPNVKKDGFMAKYGAGASGLSFTLAAIGGIGYLSLYFTVVVMAWPWLENMQPTARTIHVFKLIVGLLLFGTVSAAIYYLFVLPMMD